MSTRPAPASAAVKFDFDPLLDDDVPPGEFPPVYVLALVCRYCRTEGSADAVQATAPHATPDDYDWKCPTCQQAVRVTGP